MDTESKEDRKRRINRNYMRRMREANPEKVRAYKRNLRARNPEKALAADRAWRKKNPDKIKAQKAKYRIVNAKQEQLRIKTWIAKNPDYHSKRGKRFREKNPEYGKAYRKQWLIDNPGKSAIYSKRTRLKYPDRKLARQKNLHHRRIKVDLGYKIKCRIRSSMSSIIRRHGGAKKLAHTMELIGCSPESLCRHLESLFVNGMTWENYGKKGWHIDHIIPCAAFNLAELDQQRLCFHWSNLQPLWAIDNIKKSNRLPTRHQPELPLQIQH